MNPESLKCSQAVRAIPLEKFHLPGDGQKWKQAARSRQNLLARLSTYANGDGLFERDGRNYSPSEKTITKHVAVNTYYRLSRDLQTLGWLSWTREQKHYGRRLFVIHLDNHLPDSPKSPTRFASEYLPDSQKHLPSAKVITPSTMGNYPSSPNTSLESSSCDHDTTGDHGRTVDAQSARTDHRASPASDSVQQASTSFSHVGEDDPSVQPNRREGRSDSPSVKENDEMADSAIDFAVDDEYPELSEPLTAQAKRRIRQDYAIGKSQNWRKVPREIRDRVKVLVKKLEHEWEYWATHDDDGDVLDDAERKASSFPCPLDTQMLMLAGLLKRYTDLQLLRAWNKFLLRPASFEGLHSPRTAVWLLFEREFEIYVESEEESDVRVQHHQPPLEAFVAGLRAEPDYDGWIAKRPCAHNHEHGDENLSLVISRGEKVPVIVHCRAGCDKNEVWKQALEKAREVIDSGESLPELPEAKARSKKEFDVASDIAVILHARLNQVPKVQSWLKEWGITSEVADKLQLGASLAVEFTRDDRTKFESPAVVTPHFDHAGNIIGLKARAMSEKCFKQQEGSTIGGLFATAHLNQNDEVLVLEGDKDVAIAMSHGFNATGILSASSSVSDADIALLAKYKRVYLIGDQDKAGIAAMDRLAKRLPGEKVIRVRLPVKDIGELYQQHPSDFENRLTTLLNGEKNNGDNFGDFCRPSWERTIRGRR